MTNKIFEKLGETQVKARQECLNPTDAQKKLDRVGAIRGKTRITVWKTDGSYIEGIYQGLSLDAVTVGSWVIPCRSIKSIGIDE